MNIADWLSGATLAGALLVDEVLRFTFVPTGRVLAALLAGASAAVAALANRVGHAETAPGSSRRRPPAVADVSRRATRSGSAPA